ncbi:hypothetical protein HOK51_07380 [Candidatus Woesearchaeota archaeon]|jgi:hypothetical protein|nr:hypothetical protein [Candidatus Woesearchaeota archaeon]MBT6519644.1 hypothetical protein [Candidatus Woesearchaeota archaeon]MBT7367559.1 hypothetical protein [Candidatus Woesearchaeota archaeon]
MDTKTKTRTDDEGKPNPSGEVQVRELGDVLQSSEEEVKQRLEKYSGRLAQARLDEFRMKHMPESIETILVNEDTVEKLYELMKDARYKQSKEKNNSPIYAKFRQDQSVDVIVMNNLLEIDIGKTKRGITYLHLNDHTALRKLETGYNNIIGASKYKSQYGAAFMAMGVMGGLFGTVMGGLIGDFSLGALITGAISGAIIGIPIGYSIENGDVTKHTAKEKKIKDEFSKYQKNIALGTDAINKGLYGK